MRSIKHPAERQVSMLSHEATNITRIRLDLRVPDFLELFVADG